MSDPYGNNPYGQNQPGSYGGGAYGAPHGGSTEPPKTDGISVASLVLGLLCCTAPIGLILGFVGLSRTKGGKRKGRGLAIAGTVIGALATIALVVGGILGANFIRSFVTPENAEVGQCVDIDEDGDTIALRKKDCSEEHDGEIVYVGEAGEVEEAAGELALSMPEEIGAITTDQQAVDAICRHLVGEQAADFPEGLTWGVALEEEDAEDPADDAPFLCYVEGDNLTSSVL
ncbi:DUF4190 domain-containing protein [Nocardioides sp. SYSU DS0651]|uniref:DUF4190 domain-containing protein n=1 Tax=Nocardioides sp. SYSU DS0651 TaxID=3415955 RepID=UPI003F4BB910